jgi:hypothetical protein
MKSLYSVLSLVFLLTPMHSFAGIQSEVACQGFLPKNDMYISVRQKSRLGGLTEAQFNAVIDAVGKIYAPIIREKGGNLKVKRLWENGTVNASAQRQGKDYVVNMYGGLARHKAVTPDGFAMVVCHEIGHHIGGAPVYGGSSGGGGWGGGGVNNWASNEGQSDYFASTKCLRKLFRNFNNYKALKKNYREIPEIVGKACKKQFANNDDFMVCARTALAGLSLANLFKDLRNMPTAPDFSKPDQNRVSRTSDGHPQPQCRLDTYFQGAICDADDREEIGYDDETKGACARANGAKIGVRPFCWYKPKAARYGRQLSMNF